MKRIATLRSSLTAFAVILAISGSAHAQCVGDCSGDGAVTVDEIVTGLNIALGNLDVENCLAFDSNGDSEVTVDEIVTAVNNALNGCPDCGDCDDGDACTTDQCVGGECAHDPVMCPDDGEECTAEFCDSLTGCGRANVADETLCDGGTGSCQAGVCVAFECVSNTDCDDEDACTMDFCVDDSCSHSAVTCSDDGNECTAEACNSDSGCESTPVANGTLCEGGAGTCQAGVCSTGGVIQYQQNFEALDAMSETALSDDGWLVFGNVYNGTTGAYMYGYGAFPAPNGGAAFSAIDTGQGGAEQGDQQLSVYNDYNNTDHANGHRIEANVFRERRITAADIGTTLTFAFDAKRGNINDPEDPLCPCTTTAIAFIKTLNPAAGFATTNFIQQDTTNLPETWSRFALSLPIGPGLLNQILQVGFSSTATLFQPSGVFYDNVLVRAEATP